MSLATCIENPIMAVKRSKGRPAKGRNDVTVKLDALIASKASYVAKSKAMTMGEYLSELVGPLVERDFKKAADPLKGS